jgi:dimeric dUTPase (all-alpha-NTP-PPase superfamily)
MNIKKMIETIEPKEIDTEACLSSLRNKITTLYSNANVERYTDTLEDLLSLAVHLKFDLILKHFGAAPVVATDARTQFQEIFKCLATKNTNKNWFLELFGLFLGLASLLRLDMDAIEQTFLVRR